jgi:hypothetical protein
MTRKISCVQRFQTYASRPAHGTLSRRRCGILLSTSPVHRAYWPRVRFALQATRVIACSGEIAADRWLHSTLECKYQGAISPTGVTECFGLEVAGCGCCGASCGESSCYRNLRTDPEHLPD